MSSARPPTNASEGTTPSSIDEPPVDYRWRRVRQSPAYDSVVRHFRNAVAPARGVAVRLFERYLGFYSWGDIPAEELGYERTLYRASSWLMLRELFRNLEVADDDVFADIGSGMGRVVFMAARRPFKRVIGVERSEMLNGIARANIDRNRHRLACTAIELETVDARDWEVPDDLTVAYFFTPFAPDVLEPVVAKLVASVDRNPRHLRIIYNTCEPTHRAVIMATGRVRRISFRVPLYIRHRFDDVWMVTLRPEPS